MTENRPKDQFLDILEKNIGIILKISRAYTKSVHDKEDLINDITLELWKSFERFRKLSLEIREIEQLEKE